MEKKIVYVMGGNLSPNGMSAVLSQKINYMAENTDYDVYMILTEKAGAPFYYKISPKVKYVNFDINFDELDTMPLPKKLLHYTFKQRRYKKLFTDYLMQLRPDITVSAIRREINFINDIKDGSKKVGELHFNKSSYRVINKRYLPHFVNRFITEHWMGSLVKQIKRLDRFVVLTHRDMSEWSEIPNISVINNSLGMFPEKVSTCTEKRVISAGRFDPVKGYDMLIEAWKYVFGKHPDWKLDIYGNGEKAMYVEMIRKYGLESAITCYDAVPDIYDKYTESSIYALTSRHEGFGLVIAEAMSCGVPAVSFDCPCGPSEIIRDGEDGFLVEAENTKVLADKINYLIENDDIRKEFGKKARENSARFKKEGRMNQWLSLFNSL